MREGSLQGTAWLPELPGDACCGCGACAAACPAHCIEMAPDGCGFARPRVSAGRCVACRRCESVCPSLNLRQERDTVLGSFWARSNKREDLSTSSSGGVFGLLADAILAEGGSVYGAAWTEDWDVAHVRADDVAGVSRLKKSKYVQSLVRADVYEGVRGDLTKGGRVLFSGTGCQIAALRSYLGRAADSEGLLCVEVICHGVPSPKLWRMYVDWLQRERGARLSAFSFREKIPSWEHYSVRAEFSDGSSWQAPYMECWYMAAFMGDLSLRQSCYRCPFKRRSGSDIVLGDFWGIGDLGLGIDFDEGVSAVIANTERGCDAVAGLASCEIGEASYRGVLSGNRSLEEPARIPEGREGFLRALERETDLAPLMGEWPFDAGRLGLWARRIGKVRDLASECGVGRTAAMSVKTMGKAVAMLARGADRETLRKMAAVAVSELREKARGDRERR